MKRKQLICSICKQPIETEPETGWAGGHNAQPINNGRCCRKCNDSVVVPERIAILFNRTKERNDG
jgi:hypothetical protein